MPPSLGDDSARLLEVSDLSVRIEAGQRAGMAVDGVSLYIDRGETLGLVGESGSGKTLTALSLLGLHPQPVSRIVSGSIAYKGVELVGQPPERTMRFRGREMSMIMQDPMSALNPVFTIGHQIGESLRIHLGLNRRERRDRAIELLRSLKVSDAEKRLSQYPHQLSGGMRQRIVAAIAIACGPSLLIADEPTTALDVTVEASFLELLRELQEELDLGILFVTHDFGVVSRVCDRVAVMYAGRIVEEGPTDRIFGDPQHPYTQALLHSVPDVREDVEWLPSIPGSPPALFNRPSGCAFRTRCELHRERGEPADCVEVTPGLRRTSASSHAACHFATADETQEAADGEA